MEREGALLRINGGHADCHPWPELGDLPLNKQLEKLARNETTPLTKRSLYFAALDREARAQNRSLFEGLTIPKSHYLLLKLGDVPPHSLVKIKMGRDASALLRFLKKSSCQVRLDFNAKLTEPEFKQFLDETAEYHSRFDCIEDPFPYEESAWKRYANLACDARSEQAIGTAHTLVLKPAVQDHEPFRNLSQKLIVTSYLDHPLGQLSAAFIAAQLRVDVCGLCSHLVYQTNEFSEQLPQTTSLVPPPGTGFGFDELLKKLPWKKL